MWDLRLSYLEGLYRELTRPKLDLPHQMMIYQLERLRDNVEEVFGRAMFEEEHLPVIGKHTAVDPPELFRGDKTQDVEPWVKELEAFYLNYYPRKKDKERRLVTNLVLHLSGPALAWYHDVSMIYREREWITVKDKFLKAFMSKRERKDFETIQIEEWENLAHFMARAAIAYSRLGLTREEKSKRFRSALEKRCGIKLSSSPKYYKEAVMIVPKAKKLASDTKGILSKSSEHDLGVSESEYLMRVDDDDTLYYLLDPWFERSSTKRELKRAVHHDAVKGHYVRITVAGLSYTVPVTPQAEVSCMDKLVLRDILSKTSFGDWKMSQARETVSFSEYTETNVQCRLKIKFKIDKVNYTGYFLVLPKLVSNMILGKDFLDGYGVSVKTGEDGNQRFTVTRGDKK